MVTKQSIVTYDEFETHIHGHSSHDRLELIYGTIVEKPMPTQAHGIIATNFAFHLKLYLRENPIGYVSVETAHRAPGDDYNRRIPDVSYVSKKRFDSVTVNGAMPGMPDIAIEVLSPDQAVLELREKAHYYLSNQTSAVWIAIPESQQIEVHTPGNISVLDNQSILSSSILPGFQVKVSDLFEMS